MIFSVQTVDCSEPSETEANMMNTPLFQARTLTTLMLWLSLLFVPAAFAQSLDEAKASGLIGEKRDGYIGLVQSSAPQAVVQLIEDVNRQRRERYQQIARENGINVDQVAQLAYARAVEATKSGHYVEDANGRWVRKP
jgi:uncharacterized protein